jgi:hypothetical protein
MVAMAVVWPPHPAAESKRPVVAFSHVSESGTRAVSGLACNWVALLLHLLLLMLLQAPLLYLLQAPLLRLHV